MAVKHRTVKVRRANGHVVHRHHAQHPTHQRKRAHLIHRSKKR